MSVADMLAELERLDRERAKLMGRLRAGLAGNIAAVPDAPPVAPSQLVDQMPNDLIPAGAAAALARRAKSTVGARCRRNAFDGAGFAFKIGARWFVSKAGLLKHLRAI